MRILIVGGGPAGLYFAILMKKLHPGNEILLLERDGPHDTFGWGIVFSDQTFSYLRESDAESCDRIIRSCQTWNNVDVVHRGERITIRGNKFSGIARIQFLNILHQRCLDLGVEIRFRTPVTDVGDLPPYDLLVGADGANSLVRRTYADFFRPTVDLRKNKYIWLGTHRLFHGLTLTFRETEVGAFASHAYKFSPQASTFIVECNSKTWERAGFESKSEQQTCEYLAAVFKKDLAGQSLLSNNFVRWLNFPLVRNHHWTHQNIVLLGDALHTAHFSIGSGTKLALEDAIALSQCFQGTADVERALGEFERIRRPMVESLQEAAYSSLLLFENVQEEVLLAPMALAYKLMTRSKRIDHEKLKQRDPTFIAAYEQWRQVHPSEREQ